jgi:MFS family permease
MVTVLGLTVAQTSQILFLFNLALMLSYLVLSWWAPRHISYGGSKGLPVLKVVAVGLTGSVLIQLLMLLLPFAWAWVLWIAFAVMVTVTTLAQTHVSLSFPPKQVGRANSAFNLTLFIGAFSIQWGIGLVMDLFIARGWSASASLRIACGTYLALQVVALLAFLYSRAQPSAAVSPAMT